MGLIWLLVVGLASGLVGCASMTGEGSSQVILVRSTPPGASIYVDGQKVGQTPDLVELRRSFSPNIELATSSGRQKVDVETKYRWGRSFGRNFIFITYAWVGWFVDILTGAAWDVKDVNSSVDKLSEADLRNPKPVRRPSEIVVAPPRSSSVAMSDEGGRALVKTLAEKNETGSAVRPYDQTLRFFDEYEYGSKEVSRHRRMLNELKADYVYESYVESGDDGWILKSEAKEIYGVGRKSGPSIRLRRDAEGPRVFGVGFGLQPWWSRILPDTVGLDFVNEKLSVMLAGREYAFDTVHGDEWWATGLRYLSSINISSTPDRRREYGSRWEFSAVPSIRLSRRQVKIANLPPPSNGTFIEREPQFLRWHVSGGYGLEIGYLFGRHYVYLDIIPMLGWGQISWRQDGGDRSATRTGVTVLTELGYTYVFDSSWLIRLFSRGQTENHELWSDAFAARLGDEYRTNSANGVLSGLTIAYRFDTDRYTHAKADEK